MATARPQVFTLRDVSPASFVRSFSRHLKSSNSIIVPKWAELVKTSAHKELSPYDPDWYFVRAAAIARRVYVRPGTGVGGFRKVFGTADKRGVSPQHAALASGGVIRDILQQLEKAGLLEKDPKGGRRLTVQGQRDMDRIAQQVNRKTRK